MSPSCVTNSTRWRSGLTLIELLLSLSIAILIVTLVYSVYRTVYTVWTSHNERYRSLDLPRQTMSFLIRDLTSTFGIGNDSNCLFTLNTRDIDSTNCSEISFCTIFSPEPKKDWRWSEVERVSYRVLSDSTGSNKLIRIHKPLVGPRAFQPPQTNILIPNIREFHVQVLGASSWENTWPSGTNSSAVPAAARIRLSDTRNRETDETMIYIPAGNVIRSSLERGIQEASPP